MAPLIFIAGLFVALPITAVAQASGPWHEVAGGAWQVSREVLVHMKDKVAASASKAEIRSARKMQRSVLTDTVQYRGIVDRKSKRKLVELNGMCETDKTPDELRRSWVRTLDGGNCYYGAMYDPVRKEFVTFVFNGSA